MVTPQNNAIFFKNYNIQIPDRFIQWDSNIKMERNNV